MAVITFEALTVKLLHESYNDSFMQPTIKGLVHVLHMFCLPTVETFSLLALDLVSSSMS